MVLTNGSCKGLHSTLADPSIGSLGIHANISYAGLGHSGPSLDQHSLRSTVAAEMPTHGHPAPQTSAPLTGGRSEMITRILIDPGHGFCDENGKADRGCAVAALSELDVINGYMPALIEQLEMESLRADVLETRKAPGLKPLDRALKADNTTIVVSLHCGWKPTLNDSNGSFNAQKPSMSALNGSKALFNSPEAKELAQILARECYEWGKQVNAVHDNLGAKKSDDGILAAKNCIAVEIQPFMLNGNAEMNYADPMVLERLGMRLGMAIARYAKDLNPHLGFRPQLFQMEKK